MNTFDDAQKAKWIMKFIKKKISERNTSKDVSIKFASLLFEEGDDIETYEEFVEVFSSDSDFERLVLLAILIKSNSFRCYILMRDNSEGVYIDLAKLNKDGEMIEDGIEGDIENWREALDIFNRVLINQFPEKEQYEDLLERLRKHL